jgi:hypothetical protein
MHISQAKLYGMSISLIEVSGRKQLEAFVRFPDRLYRNCSYYIPALHNGQLSTLSKEKNPAFAHCEARYWLAFSGGEIVGRVAGIINHLYNQERNARFIRFGWLDFVEDEQVLRILMNAVEDWGKEHQMEHIHGPLGFTSFDASGVLVEGFDEWPTSFGRYNFPYYDKAITGAGYRKDIDWVEFMIKIPDRMPEKLMAAARLIEKRYGVRNVELQGKKDLEAFAGKVFELLNTVYKDLYGFSTLSPAQVDALTREFLSMIHPDFISVVLNEQDELVAFGLVMPSLAKALKKSHGKLFPFGFVRIMRALRHNDTADLLLIGVKPEYQNKGLHALVFDKIGRTFYKRGIKTLETTRELEENNRVKQLWADYDTRQHKRARCYIKTL